MDAEHGRGCATSLGCSRGIASTVLLLTMDLLLALSLPCPTAQSGVYIPSPSQEGVGGAEHSVPAGTPPDAGEGAGEAGAEQGSPFQLAQSLRLS